MRLNRSFKPGEDSQLDTNEGGPLHIVKPVKKDECQEI